MKMKRIGLRKANIDAHVKNAQHERVMITRNGKPVALLVGVEGMDEEQVQLASSNIMKPGGWDTPVPDLFWTLISERRAQKTITRAELEKRISRKRA